MSSSSSSNVFARLGLLPSTNSSSRRCSHGCCAGHHGHGAAVAYPYNVTAAFLVEGLVLYVDRGHPEAAEPAFREMMNNGSIHHENLIQSIVMLGTDLLLHANEKANNTALASKLATLASKLASTLLIIENIHDGTKKKKERYSVLDIQKIFETNLNLDCMRNVVRFYDSRNPCSCLKQVKEQHKERIGRCRNPTCKTSYCLDAKLLVCSACQVCKYCCKECQIADWPRHKKYCKKVQKEMKELEGSARTS